MVSLYESMPIAITGPGTRYFDLLQRGLEEGLGQSQQVRLFGEEVTVCAKVESIEAFSGHADRDGGRGGALSGMLGAGMLLAAVAAAALAWLSVA